MADTSGPNQKELDTPNANQETTQDKDVEQPFLPNKCRKFGLLEHRTQVAKLKKIISL